MRTGLSICLGLCLGCADSDPPADSSGDLDSESDDSSGTDADGETSTDDAETTDDESETTDDGPADPCLASDAAADCPDGCSLVTASPGSDTEGSCGSNYDPLLARELCVTLGEPFPAFPLEERTTFHIELDGVTHYLYSGGGCGAPKLPARPVYLPECTGAEGEPPVCLCGCAQDICGFEADLDLLATCLDSPCDAVSVNPDGDAPGYTVEQQCLLAAMRDQTQGAYSITADIFHDDIRHWRLHIVNGSVQNIDRKSMPFCSPKAWWEWEPTEHCTLEDPAYFEACLASTDEQEQFSCLLAHNWLLDCVEMPASCE